MKSIPAVAVAIDAGERDETVVGIDVVSVVVFGNGLRQRVPESRGRVHEHGSVVEDRLREREREFDVEISDVAARKNG
jgi:hypothetical protein